MNTHSIDDMDYAEAEHTGPRCGYCNRAMPEQQGPGRPLKYCTPSCRQGAYRARSRKASRPVTDGSDGNLLELALDVQEEVRHYVRLLSDQADPLEALQSAVRIERQMEVLTAATVRHARRRHIAWHFISTALGMSTDAVRRRFRAERIERQTYRALAQRTESPVLPEPPKSTLDAEQPTKELGRLAPTMSIIQRGSGMPLRVIGLRVQVSPSYLSRVLCGVKFPSWELTERFAEVCGAPPETLRPMWEEESRARRRPHPRWSTYQPRTHAAITQPEPAKSQREVSVPDLHVLAEGPTEWKLLLPLAEALTSYLNKTNDTGDGPAARTAAFDGCPHTESRTSASVVEHW